MKRLFKTCLGIMLSVLMIAASPASQVLAYSERPEYFDFGDAVLSIDAGSEKKMWFKSIYDYSYYIKGATSDGTYCECSFGSGSQYVTFHIGADEQGKNVFFHFYVVDPKVESLDVHDCVEIYVQNIQNNNPAISVPLAGGKTGTLRQQDRVSMLYNQDGVPMASFSLSYGEGRMAHFSQVSVCNNGAANYFNVVTGLAGAYPRISESDKAVMLANGYAGVFVNGQYRNW